MTRLGVHPSASWLSDQATTYQRMLEQWVKLRENDGKSSPLVAFILEDEAPSHEHKRLSYGRLKENHMHKARFLEQQCIQSNVCFWLARMSSSVDSSGDGASESNFKLDRISELDGTQVVEGIIRIDKEDVVDIDSFKSRIECGKRTIVIMQSKIRHLRTLYITSKTGYVIFRLLLSFFPDKNI